MNELILALIGAVATVLAHKFKLVKLPSPDPDPAVPTRPNIPPVVVPPGTPTVILPSADKPAVDFLDWLIQVRAGRVLLDQDDRQVLGLIRAAIPDDQPAQPPVAK